MRQEPLTFGEALALVEAKVKQKIDFQSYVNNSSNIKMLERMLTSYQEKKEQGTTHTIPNGCCMADKPFLQEDDAYFISHILIDDALPEHDENNKPFIKHLNDCYWCFKIYSQVLREYYWGRQKIDKCLGGPQ